MKAEGPRRIRRWTTVRAEPPLDLAIMTLETVTRRSPETGAAGRYHVLHSAPWINVVALTPDEHVVLIEQYRQGIDDVTLEIPGGMVDPGETAATAAARELLEETGYAGAPPVELGVVQPNPAIQSNVCTTFLIADAQRVRPQRAGDDVHIRVSTRPIGAIADLIRRGRILHALVIAAFHHYDLQRRP